MKCNELMVGDWIADSHGFPMQVTTVGQDFLYADFEDNEGDAWEFDDKDSLPYPVALTGDFFKRNDFDRKILYWSEGSAICEKNGSNGYNLVVRLFDSPCGPATNAHYVHELQQLLRLGGYAELANNIKL